MTLLPPNILKCMSPKDRNRLGKAGLLPSEISAKNVARTEKELQQDIANLLRRNGIWFDQDVMCKRRTGTKGTPDFLFAVKGKACAIEAKLLGQKPRPEQERAHAEMRRNGWCVAVITTVPEALEFLKGVL